MTDRLSDLLLSNVVDANGNVLSGAQVFFYRVGTSTKKDTYSDSAKTTANANPMVLDSAGRLPADVFMLTDEQYKVVLAPSTDTDPPTSPILTKDNVSPVRSTPVADIDALAKSANYTVLVGDKGKWINTDASSGAVTITLPAVATATNGFFVYVKKIDSSANAVTVDADAAETIDGSTTFELPNQYDTGLFMTDGTEWHAFIPTLTVPLPTEHLNGLVLSADSGDTANDVNITAGSARDDADSENMVLAAEITKQIDAAWAVGDDAGGLDTGAVADGNRYYIWLIKRIDTDVEDALFSLSASAPTMPTNYTKKRLIGFLDRVSAANTQLTKINTSTSVIQVIHTQDGAVNTGTTVIPLDDTIPQNTEGDEYMTLAVTPTDASNQLIIDVTVFGAHNSTGTDIIAALFQDSTADALAAGWAGRASAANSVAEVTFRHRMLAGTTSETDFKVRAGSPDAGTFTFNGSSAARLFGGVAASSITITEISQ